MAVRTYDPNMSSMTIREKVARAPHPLRLSHSSTTAVINAFLAAAAEEGWEMTPDQPTESMLKWGARDIGKSMRETNHIERAKSCYRAMLAAAPEFEWDK